MFRTHPDAYGSSPRGRGTRAGGEPARFIRRFIPARAGNTGTRRKNSRTAPVHPRAGGEHVPLLLLLHPGGGSSPRGRGTRTSCCAPGWYRRFIPARAGNTSSSMIRRCSIPVHPRAGGEHICLRVIMCSLDGSSPRGRGTPRSGRSGRARGRFIPARAGNTRTRRSARSYQTVHPRAGGEHRPTATLTGITGGSSPRGRGTREQAQEARRPRRFIPARAGNTPGASASRPHNPVHPRAGGEHGLPNTSNPPMSGSSPRGRGTLLVALALDDGHRFIPARAGNTRPPASGTRPSPVHPRAGGEHFISSRWTAALYGSSPRGRGTRREAVRRPSPRRFIPARAGNTAPCQIFRKVLTVHPRAGGEHEMQMRRQVRRCGSSPRGRGTPRSSQSRPDNSRFIPARAGNTIAAVSAEMLLPVHPRAGGEHLIPNRSPLDTAGSSPRGRGTLDSAASPRRVARFIPARAGNTCRPSRMSG